MKLKVKEIAVFALLGAIMIATKKLMEGLPNIHLLGTMIVAITVVYRKKALYPIYLYVLLEGLFAGFAVWWLPYLYLWTILWGMTMLLPKKMPTAVAPIVYCAVCALHGFLFGTLGAPAYALIYGLHFRGMIDWIIAGFPFDCIHGVSNACCGLLIVPLIRLLKRFAASES